MSVARTVTHLAMAVATEFLKIDGTIKSILTIRMFTIPYHCYIHMKQELEPEAPREAPFLIDAQDSYY